MDLRNKRPLLHMWPHNPVFNFEIWGRGRKRPTYSNNGDGRFFRRQRNTLHHPSQSCPTFVVEALCSADQRCAALPHLDFGRSFVAALRDSVLSSRDSVLNSLRDSVLNSRDFVLNSRDCVLNSLRDSVLNSPSPLQKFRPKST